MRTKVSYNPAGFSCAFAYHDHALLRSPGSARRLAHAESKLGPARFDAAKHWVLPQFHPAVGDKGFKSLATIEQRQPMGVGVVAASSDKLEQQQDVKSSAGWCS